jgi:phage gp36-like protein
MMAYTSPSNIREIMRKLPSSIIDDDLNYHIEKADALIDGKLGGVYSTPFEPVPRLIQDISTDLAIFFMAESLYSSNMPNMDEYQQTRYDRAMELLNGILEGDISLGRDHKRNSDAGFATTNDQQIFTYEDPEW